MADHGQNLAAARIERYHRAIACAQRLLRDLLQVVIDGELNLLARNSLLGRQMVHFLPTLFTTTRRMPSVPCSRSLYWRSSPDLPTKSPGRKRPLLTSICCSLTSPTYPLAWAMNPPRKYRRRCTINISSSGISVRCESMKAISALLASGLMTMG